MGALYTVIHLLVVDVACVLFWTQSVCMVPNQNTRNIYHKQMNNGVDHHDVASMFGGNSGFQLTWESVKRLSGIALRVNLLFCSRNICKLDIIEMSFDIVQMQLSFKFKSTTCKINSQ